MNIKIDPVEVLSELMKRHFGGNGYEWIWQEGISLRSRDPELAAKIDFLLSKKNDNSSVG